MEWGGGWGCTRGLSGPRTTTNSRKWSTLHPSARIDFIRPGSIVKNRKSGLSGEQLAVGPNSRSVAAWPGRMFSVATEVYHVGSSREFVGPVYCTYGQSNTTNVVR